MQKSRHGLCIFVENEFGVIQRVTNLFSARGMNIETIYTKPVDASSNVSLIAISLFEKEESIELIKNLLKRLIIVHEVFSFLLDEEFACGTFKVNLKSIDEVKEILRIKKYEYIYSENEIFCAVGKSNVVKELLNHCSHINNFSELQNYNIF